MSRIASRLPHLAVLLLLATAGCNTYGIPLPDAAAAINESSPGTLDHIFDGDRLEVRFPFKKDWDQTVAVRSDGRASFISLGELQVRGMTIEELQKKLADTGEEGAVVNLAWAERDTESARMVWVIGDVRTPGPQRMQTRLITLLEAIGNAGGPIKETANLGDVYLVRTMPDGVRYSWHLDARPEHWSGTPIRLRERDVIFVPNTGIDDVDIWMDQYIRRMIPLPTFLPSVSY